MFAKFAEPITKGVLNNIVGRGFSKAHIKKITPESFIKTTPIQKESKIHDVEIKIEKFDKKTYVRGLAEDEKPIPISPKLGPIRVI
jgi:hypothetical protein